MTPSNQAPPKATTGPAIPPEKEPASGPFNGIALPRFAPSPASGPRVVAVEGPNGAGKSTLCRFLGSTLGIPALLGTDPAWCSESFKSRMIRDADWFASAMFFLSGCFEQMRLIRRMPERLVLLDRSLWSTLAVHAAQNPERLAALAAMLHPVAGQVRIPDLTLVLEASLPTCQSRIARKPQAERVLDDLTAEAGFHAREREFYHWLAGQDQEVVFLDADRYSEGGLTEQSRELIRARMGC